MIKQQTSGMKPEHLGVLVECYRRMRELADAPRPEGWQTWLVGDYDEQVEHGPKYACGGWFGPTPEHQRMRYRRAIDYLEQIGLLITWRRWGRRLSHIRLTKQGEVVAKAHAGHVNPPQVCSK